MGGVPFSWWREPGVLHRFTCDLLAAELARLRPGRPAPVLPWAPELRLEEDLGADSLERLQLATALTEATHFRASGIGESLTAGRTVAEWTAAIAAGLDRFSAQFTFRTSGSTGHPKWCVHELASLEAEVAFLVTRLGGVQRVLGSVPSHHIYGFLFEVLLPLRLGAGYVDVRVLLPSQVADEAEPGDAIVAYPEFWRMAARSALAFRPGIIAVNSTGPCPAEAVDAVRAAGIHRFIDVFGSSETAGIGLRDDPAAAYELFPYWRRGDSDRELVRRMPDGTERTVRAPDELTWMDVRRVRPGGRAEGAVQVGGTNVFPQRVAALLAARPGVAAAAVRLMRPDEGDRLKAFIVPADPAADPAALVAELWAWIDASLTVPERPKSIATGPVLPSGTLGKLADWPIPAASDGLADGRIK
jgi:4-coumarate--CoA ligase (photoactive yellow protein activation family)